MSDSQLDDRLRAYLDREESERALGNTNSTIITAVRNLSDALGEHKGDDVERFAAVHSRLEQHDFRLGSVEKVAAKVEAKAEQLVEDTGKHQIVVAERRADGPIKVLLALMGAALAVVGTLLVWALTKR